MFKTEEDYDFIEEQLENGQIKRYIKGRTLGKGGFAECFECTSQQTGKRYAAKVIAKESLNKGKAKEKLESQIRIHKGLKHENIVKFEHFFQDHEFVYILLQLCQNNTLNELVKRRKVLTQVEVRYYIWQLLQALRYIHQQKVIHRDLKLGNFFLNDRLELKVGDFGLATMLSSNHEKRRTVCGTPNYIAPEVIQGKKGHSYQVDLWSTGVVVFALLFGRPPFETNEVKYTYEKIKQGQYSFPKSNVSDEAKDFVKKMLVVHPSERATINELFEHDFLSKGEIPKGLPLSTLACPPSRAFLDQLKAQKKLIDSRRKSSQKQVQIKSSRTSKDLSKLKTNIVTSRYESSRNLSKQRIADNNQGSMTRIASTASILSKKKLSISEALTIPLVTFFEQQPKYGMFYVLNSKSLGMRFNDHTCMNTTSSLIKLRYVTLHNHVQTASSVFEAGEQPETLHKKVKILNHFGKLFSNKYFSESQQGQNVNKTSHSARSKVYMISFYTTSNYTLFWLSNGTFQASFKDDFVMIIEDKLIHTIKNGKHSTFRKDHESQFQEIKQRYNHVCTVIRKVKKIKVTNGQPRRQKEKENVLQHSVSQAKQMFKVESKSILRKQFSSTNNLHMSLKRPLSDYNSNKDKRH